VAGENNIAIGLEICRICLWWSGRHYSKAECFLINTSILSSEWSSLSADCCCGSFVRTPAPERKVPRPDLSPDRSASNLEVNLQLPHFDNFRNTPSPFSSSRTAHCMRWVLLRATAKSAVRRRAAATLVNRQDRCPRKCRLPPSAVPSR
ncbi:hypothetical protein T310_9461, partial [Rasamsonia emersonii CBS 393.64]